MAQAKLNTKTESRTEEKRVVTEVKTEVVDSVTLTLTLDEARLVRTMVGQASGGGLLRRLSENVFEALDRAGVGSFGREAFDQRPALATVTKLPRTSYENLPKPKEVREDICGTTSAKPELRIGARIRITDNDGHDNYPNGSVGTVISFLLSPSETGGPRPVSVRFDHSGKTHSVGIYSKYEVIG